jgi:formiminotetrahydrofolate cyclodeaminase
MEAALKDACSVPMDIMRACSKSIDVIAEFAVKGSALAISDAGVGVAFAKAALMGASLNVFINTKSMTDKAYAAKIESEADGLLNKYCELADKIYESVISRLR